jgi:hypothetical protein
LKRALTIALRKDRLNSPQKKVSLFGGYHQNLGYKPEIFFTRFIKKVARSDSDFPKSVPQTYASNSRGAFNSLSRQKAGQRKN